MKSRTPRIVIVGAGFAGLYTYLNLHKRFHARKDAPEVVLISKHNYFLFTPLLHEVATGSVNPSHIIQPVRQVVDPCLKELIVDEVREVNLDRRVVVCKEGEEVSYDYLVLAPGSTTSFYGLPKDKVFTLKDMEDARTLKNRIVTLFDAANREEDKEERKRLLTFVVIGGGPTGVEVSAEISEFAADTLLELYPYVDEEEVTVYLVQSGKELIPQFDVRLRKKAEEVLRKKNRIRVLLGVKVADVTGEEVILNNGERIPTKTPILAAGIEAKPIGFSPEVKINKKGQVEVDECLHLPSHKEVFVAGDMAAIPWKEACLPVGMGRLVPQTAQAAVQEGEAVAKNIIASLQGKAYTPFKLKEKGQLLSLGRWMAAAEISGITFFGHFAWWVWRTIYASKLIGWANRLRVVIDWTVDMFYPRDTSKL